MRTFHSFHLQISLWNQFFGLHRSIAFFGTTLHCQTRHGLPDMDCPALIFQGTFHFRAQRSVGCELRQRAAWNSWRHDIAKIEDPSIQSESWVLLGGSLGSFGSPSDTIQSNHRPDMKLVAYQRIFNFEASTCSRDFMVPKCKFTWPADACCFNMFIFESQRLLPGANAAGAERPQSESVPCCFDAEMFLNSAHCLRVFRMKSLGLASSK